MTAPLRRGQVVWVDLNPTRGREQKGTRPALVVCSNAYLDSVRGLAVVVPVTTVDRGWPHHVALVGAGLRLRQDSFAMTEQLRTVTLERVGRRAGEVDSLTMAAVDEWLRDFLQL